MLVDIKKVKRVVKDLVAITKSENSLQHSRKEKATNLFNVLNIKIDSLKGVGELSSFQKLKEKFNKSQASVIRAIEETLFNEWCNLTESRNNKGRLIQGGKLVLDSSNSQFKGSNKITLDVSFKALYDDSSSEYKKLKKVMDEKPEVKYFFKNREKDEEQGKGLMEQHKVWKSKEYKKICNALLPESEKKKNPKNHVLWEDRIFKNPFEKMLESLKDNKSITAENIELLTTEIKNIKKLVFDTLANDTKFNPLDES
jgi:hypothetical protein|tara:strand:+ start:334 stop:1101 length:768 start_codon:yes stop_codon:yes gene_type:complete